MAFVDPVDGIFERVPISVRLSVFTGARQRSVGRSEDQLRRRHFHGIAIIFTRQPFEKRHVGFGILRNRRSIVSGAILPASVKPCFARATGDGGSVVSLKILCVLVAFSDRCLIPSMTVEGGA